MRMTSRPSRAQVQQEGNRSRPATAVGWAHLRVRRKAARDSRRGRAVVTRALSRALDPVSPFHPRLFRRRREATGTVCRSSRPSPRAGAPSVLRRAGIHDAVACRDRAPGENPAVRQHAEVPSLGRPGTARAEGAMIPHDETASELPHRARGGPVDIRGRRETAGRKHAASLQIAPQAAACGDAPTRACDRPGSV